MASVNGSCDPKFSALRDIFAANLNSGEELGASICVNVNGQTVVDLWGGYASADRDTPWTSDTVVVVWSLTKTIAALATLLLIDRGDVDANAPLAKYWPEFNTEDKKDILVRHVLAHTTGLPSWDPPIEAKELLTNIPLVTEKLIAQKPWWTPGTATGYQLVSQGPLLSGLIQRASGQPHTQFIREQLALPRDADFFLPIPQSEYPRIARLVPPGPPPPDFPLPTPGSIGFRALFGSPMQAEVSETDEFRSSGIPSMAGHSNARAVNRLLSIITLRGTVDGKRFLSPETVDLIFQEQARGTDLVLGIPLRMGIGFGLSNPVGEKQSPEWMPAGEKVCWWGGWGGSLGLMDLDRGVTITYTMNKMEQGTLGNSRVQQYVKAIYEVLDKAAIGL